MATFLDITLLEKTSIIFPFLLTFVVVYGVLNFTKVFGDNKALQSFFALVVALFTFISPVVRIIINRMAPWFIILFIAILFVVLAFKTYGATDSDILGILRSPRYGPTLSWWLIIIAIIIVIGSIVSATLHFDEDEGVRPSDEKITTGEGETTKEAKDNDKTDIWDILLHPKVLGLAAILLIANFAISKLAFNEFPKP